MGRFLEWGALNSQVMVGGVLVFWDNRVLKLTGMEIRDFSISNRFKNIENGSVGFLWGGMATTIGRLIEAFWKELGTIGGLCQDPWCLGGDFNVIRFMRERK